MNFNCCQCWYSSQICIYSWFGQISDKNMVSDLVSVLYHLSDKMGNA